MNKSVFQSSSGYTFIELLIALTILGLIVTPILMMFSGSLLAINNAGHNSAAINLCRQQMESIKALGYESALLLYSSDNGNNSHRENNINGFPEFERVTTVKPYNLSCPNTPDLEVKLILIEITVSWDHQGIVKEESLQGLLSSR
ncbi:MAG: type II secretion system protein [Bacillota bacterium]